MVMIAGPHKTHFHLRDPEERKLCGIEQYSSFFAAVYIKTLEASSSPFAVVAKSLFMIIRKAF